MRTIRLAWPVQAPIDPAEEIYLSEDQARHGALALRLKPGAAVEMVGAYGLAPAVICAVNFNKPFSKKCPGLSVRLTGPWEERRQDGPRLALALIQSQRFDWAVEKSVELGAARFIPLICERCKSADAQPGPAKQERWRRLAESAHKQCGRKNQMDISLPLTITDLTRQCSGPGYFLSPEARRRLSHYPAVASISADSAAARCPDWGRVIGPANKSEFFSQPSPLLIVGPEGGFSEAEEKAFCQAEFRPLNLGATVLRSETAALAILSIFLFNSCYCSGN